MDLRKRIVMIFKFLTKSKALIVNKKCRNSLRFLHKVAKGGSVKSYGIEAARLAGVPKEVIQKARKILNGLENKNCNNIQIST